MAYFECLHELKLIVDLIYRITSYNVCYTKLLRYRSLIRDRIGPRALFPSPGEEFPRAAAVGLLAERMLAGGAAEDPRAVVPAYLRPSEAEVRRRR